MQPYQVKSNTKQTAFNWNSHANWCQLCHISNLHSPFVELNLSKPSNCSMPWSWGRAVTKIKVCHCPYSPDLGWMVHFGILIVSSTMDQSHECSPLSKIDVRAHYSPGAFLLLLTCSNSGQCTSNVPSSLSMTCCFNHTLFRTVEHFLDVHCSCNLKKIELTLHYMHSQ
jgi:hypothetical protein